MFRLSLSHLQALMIQSRTKNVLRIVESPTLTISVVNDNENIALLHSIRTTAYMFSLLFTLIVIHYRYCERWGSHSD